MKLKKILIILLSCLAAVAVGAGGLIAGIALLNKDGAGTSANNNSSVVRPYVPPYTPTPTPHEHAWGEGSVTKAPTCIVDGEKTYTCACGETKKEEIPATGEHIFTNYVSDENATCTIDGTKTATCDYGGCEEKSTITDEGSATGEHIFTEYFSDENATCTVDGTKTATCDYDGCEEKDTVADEGSATGVHIFTNYIPNDDATCVEDGTKTAECDYKGCEVKDNLPDVGSATGIHIYVDGFCKHCGLEKQSEGLEYKTHYTWAEVKSVGTCTDTDIIIPSTYEGMPVIKIEAEAFKDCTSLSSVKMPDSMQSIAYAAFAGCTSLRSIEIPDSVTYIAEYAFADCTSLTEIELPDEVKLRFSVFENTGYYNDERNWEEGVLYIGNHLIEAKDTLAGVYTIREGTLSIAQSAFYQCDSLTSIEISNSVRRIGESAFSECDSLTSVVIPNSVKSIEAYAFSACRMLASVVIGDSVTNIGNGAFDYCKSLTSVTIGGSVTSIGSGAFSDCVKLIEVYNKSGLTITAGSSASNHAGYYAKNVYTPKSGASKLSVENECIIYTDGEEKLLMGYAGSETQLVFPDGITGVYQRAFYKAVETKCSWFTSIVIGDSVTSISEDAFWGCSLTSVYYKGDIAGWCGITFESVNANPLYAGADLYINDTLVTEVVIPVGVKNIPAYAFYTYDFLTSVVISDSVTSIGNQAFYNCTALESVVIGDSVESIGENAFAGCICLTSIEIPNSVISIGMSAFSGCSSLTSVVIGDSVTSIGERAFYYCTSLTSITVDENNSAYQSINENLYSKDGTTLIQYAVGNKTTSFSISNSVTSVGTGAFSGCSSLTSVSIAGSVRNIGDQAFYDCTFLAYISFRGTMDRWRTIKKGSDWNDNVGATEVRCHNGSVTL